MPIHDWIRVSAGTFHHFHTGWIPEISKALNRGILPPDYYAMSEQVARDVIPDVLTLKAVSGNGPGAAADSPQSGAPGGAVATLAPPQLQYTASTELDQYARLRHTLVIRHSSDDRVVALVEIVSPGNKANRQGLRSFVDKAVAALAQRLHLLLIDLFPPGPRAPQGIHGAVWDEIGKDAYQLTADKRLTLASYSSGEKVTAHVQPVNVGEQLPEMPLFLTPDFYVGVPLEATYQAAWEGVPRRWQRVLEQE